MGGSCPWLDAAALSLCLFLDLVRHPNQLVRGETHSQRSFLSAQVMPLQAGVFLWSDLSVCLQQLGST